MRRLTIVWILGDSILKWLSRVWAALDRSGDFLPRLSWGDG